jgi:hypothetical protein
MEKTFRSVLLTKYYSAEKTIISWAEHAESVGDRRGPYRVFVEKP